MAEKKKKKILQLNKQLSRIQAVYRQSDNVLSVRLAQSVRCGSQKAREWPITDQQQRNRSAIDADNGPTMHANSLEIRNRQPIAATASGLGCKSSSSFAPFTRSFPRENVLELAARGAQNAVLVEGDGIIIDPPFGE